MAISSDIRDQAYQFFIEEAPELLQVIEAGLLTLRQEHNTAKVHNLMRAAHSIKGGAASVELEAIAAVSHRLENIFKALYSETLEIDTDLESQLLQAYDCLRLPLMQQITAGDFNAEEALAIAEPIFAQLEEEFADALAQTDSYIPSSAELGVDMTKSIFEVDVAQGLERLAAVLAHPKDYDVAGELRAQAEVFAGFAELLNEPKFGAIANTTLKALDTHPERALEITQLALTDFQLVRQAVLTGDYTKAQSPSSLNTLLAELAESTPDTDALNLTAIPTAELTAQDLETAIPLLEDVFGSVFVTPTIESVSEAEPIVTDIEVTITALEDVFGNTAATPNTNAPALTTLPADEAEEALAITQMANEDRELEETFSVSSECVVCSTGITCDADDKTDAPDSPVIVEIEWVASDTSVTEEAAGETPSLEEVFSNTVTTSNSETSASNALVLVTSTSNSPQQQHEDVVELRDIPAPETLEVALQSIEQIFDKLPPLPDIPTETSVSNPVDSAANSPAASKAEAAPTSNLSVRVDSQRLGRMNNLVGELAINRNGLSLQNEQLQASVRELLDRFARVQNQVGQLQQLSDKMLVGTSSSGSVASRPGFSSVANGKWSLDKTKIGEPQTTDQSHFDSLELDSYGALHLRLQGFLEDMMQLEESVDDIVLFAKATDQSLEQQRQMLTQLRDEVMWARMLPLGEVLNRFPRVLRDLGTTYQKPVNLKLTGTSVLVDKAVLERLYDPLLHLLRNAFDHGIELPNVRRQKGKPEAGQIEIRAYHQGSQTIIEVKDDGQGLNLERIRNQALSLGLVSAQQLATTSNNRLFEYIFEPGFSTASQVSRLSGRGVGLDVVRSQMRSLKGSVTVTSSPEVGTTFTLRLPLTLTIAKLLVCFIGSSALAMPSDSIEEIVIPKGDQIKESGTQRFLHWRGQIAPVYRLAELLDYSCPLPDTAPSKALISVPSPETWALPMLVLRQDQQIYALEIDRLVTEQELVIKPFGAAIAPPSCTYGCTILGDGSLIPVIDATLMLEQLEGKHTAATARKAELAGQRAITRSLPQESMVLETLDAIPSNGNSSVSKTPAMKTVKVPTVLVVDDAVALRRTLALTLERAGCRVLQARDGREALEQLQRTSSVALVICDIEMPNMNGFEFLSSRRQDAELSKIPVVMLTSRSNDKHRWLAMQLGATAYFTKPYLEQDFLGAITQLIAQSTPESLPALQPTF